MKKFSFDGLTLPNKYPQFERSWFLQAVRIIFDIAAAKLAAGICSTSAKNPDTALTEDEKYIIQYIAGYILQKMKKGSKDQEEYDIICTMISSEPVDSTPQNSLISILQNREFGELTVPVEELVTELVKVELLFRSEYCFQNIIRQIMSKLDMDKLEIVQGQSKRYSSVLEKIIRYFLKIRCYQKSKVINSEHNHHKDQNVSQRKVLKSLSKRK